MTADPVKAELLVKTPSLWRNTGFLLMWVSVAASGFGDRMIQLAAWPLLGMNLPDAQVASIQASVTFFFFLPFMLLGPVGGWLADTLPRKWLMLFCDEARGVVLVAAAVLLWWFAPTYAGEAIPEDHPLGWLAVNGTYAVLFLTGSLAAIFAPTRDAMVPQIVPMRQLQGANALILAIATIAAMIGLGVGGWIIDNSSVLHAVGVGAACFAISGTFWAFLRPREHRAVRLQPRPSEWKRLIAAAKYVRVHGRIMTLIWLSLLFWALANVALASIAAICKAQYQIQDGLVTAITTMQLAIGLGMLVSSLLLMVFNTLRESQSLLQAGLVASGLLVSLLSLSPTLSVGVAVCFFIGFFSNFIRVCTDTLTQALSPNYIRGRVFGLREILTSGAAVLINLFIWQLPDADVRMVLVLPWIGLLLPVVGCIGLWRTMTHGPLGTRALNVLWRFTRFYCFAWHRLAVVGKHHVPRTGPVLIAPNHTTGLDPFAVQSGMNRLVRWVMLTSYQYRVLNPVWKRIRPIALDRGGSDLGKLRAVIQQLRDGEVVGLFPEGALQRTDRELKSFEPGVGMIAKRGGATVVPVWIDGTPRMHHMFWHFAWRSQTTVVFGQPFTPAADMSHEAIAEELRLRMIDLQQQVEQRSRPRRRDSQ